MKILLVGGARPNWPKIAALWRCLMQFEVHLAHAGQHYDFELSEIFFRDLDLPRPALHFGVGSGTHAQQTSTAMCGCEKACLEIKPDCVMVVGDVNSTLGCALAAKKMGIPVAHVEAGLRCDDEWMPEEINRRLTDAVSSWLFAPSLDACCNLIREGILADRTYFVGNVMIDSLVRALPLARSVRTCREHDVKLGRFVIVTLHRPINVDKAETLTRILDSLMEVGKQYDIIWPIHPRTEQNIATLGLTSKLVEIPHLQKCEPLGYLEFIGLMRAAIAVITDSGGIQEETTFLGIPCITVRDRTERPITISEGTNELAQPEQISELVARVAEGNWKTGKIPRLWDGKAAERIAGIMARVDWHEESFQETILDSC